MDTSGAPPANSESNDSSRHLTELRAGGEESLAKLFEKYSARLHQMVRLRMDRRLQGRIDPADVLQETYLEAAQRFPKYLENPEYPLFLWLRFLAGQKLIDLHRRHLGAKMRDAGQEISLYSGAFPEASSVSLAAQLLGKWTSVSQALVRAEMQLKVQEAINSLEPMDREILTLRHFEMLTNDETAQVLGLSKQAASNRFIRALRRLKEQLAGLPGFPGRVEKPSPT